MVEARGRVRPYVLRVTPCAVPCSPCLQVAFLSTEALLEGSWAQPASGTVLLVMPGGELRGPVRVTVPYGTVLSISPAQHSSATRTAAPRQVCMCMCPPGVHVPTRCVLMGHSPSCTATRGLSVQARTSHTAGT